jgi:hypothetical protein
MITAHLFSLDSTDLARDAVPSDPTNCCVSLTAKIGPSGGRGGDNFAFEVVTPRYLLEQGSGQWGRGWLVLDEFSWSAVDRMVRRLLTHASAPTWADAAQKLNQELRWEFDGYTPYKPQSGAG